MKALYAPDTNFFLQFRQASDVAWKDLTPADEVELVILLAVLRELDNHNHGPAGRKRRAAERVLKSIRGLEPGKDVVLRERNPRVVYRELEPLDFKAEIPAWIDISKPDEAALAEILEYRAAGIADLQLLTADQTLVRVARRAGLKAIEPPDEWKLPPEPDPKEKRLAELERQMGLVLGRAPEIAVWPEVAGQAVDTVELSLQRFRPLSEAFVRRALSAVKRLHPDALEVRRGITVYTADSMETYRTKREAWLAEIRKVLEHLHVWLTIQRGLAKLDVCLQNKGAAIARGFVVEVDAEGPFRFVDMENDEQEQLMAPLTLPEPPKIRSPYDLVLSDRFLADPITQNLRGPNFQLRALPDSPEFDWSYEELVVDQVRGTCGQFRRERQPDRHTLTLLVPTDLEIKDEVRGRLGGWYTANDLPEQGTFGFPVRIHFDWQDTEAEAARLLREQLQVEL